MSEPAAPPTVQAAEASEKVAQGATLLDVRTPEEFAQGHAPGALNIPVKVDDGQGGMKANPEFVQQVQSQLKPGQPVVCTCAHGRRGGDAASQLAAAGFGVVLNMAGGMAAWSDAGLPCEGAIKRHH